MTFEQGTNMALALSPTDSSLALDLQGTLWLLELGSDEARAITDYWGDVRQPVWSPDGERIAFQSYRDGNWHIWSIARDGTDLRRHTVGPYDHREPSWSPSGRHLAFASDRSGNYDVWLLELRSRRLRRLTADPANDYSPSFSPSGERLAFISERSPEAGIYVLEPFERGGEPVLLAASPHRLGPPAWHPEGTEIVFQSLDETAGETSLVAVGTGPDTASRVLRGAGEDIFPFRPAYTSDGGLLYTANGEIRRLDLESGETAPIPFAATVDLERPSYVRQRYDWDDTRPRTLRGVLAPVLEPEGDRVAFTALGDLWLFAPGAPPRRLTDDIWVEAHPRWSADGRQLLVQSDRGGRGMSAWVVDVGSGEIQPLRAGGEPLAGNAIYPAWSPSGLHVAFFGGDASNPLAGTLRVLDRERGTIEPLLDRVVPPAPISWTADGRSVVIPVLDPHSSRFREGTYKLLLVDLDGASRFLDPKPHITLTQPTFSGDGARVAFVQQGVLAIADLSRRAGTIGPPRAVTRELAASPSWSGDGMSLVYLAAERLKRIDLASGSTVDVGLELEWQPEPPGGAWVLHAGRLFDGRSPEVRTDVDLLIVGHRISRVMNHRDEFHGANWLDASDELVMPGLFDMHAHQGVGGGERLGRTWLAFGITSVREPGADPYDALERRESWASGRRPGPREFFAGPLLDGSRVYYSIAEGTATPPHVDLAVERARHLRYDLIKTYVRLPDAVQRRVVQQAHAAGIPVSSHEIFPAAAHGMDMVEHIGATSRRGYSPKVSQLGHSYDDVVQIVARSGINQTPTLVLPGYYVVIAERPELLENRQFQALYGKAAVATARQQAATLAQRPALRARAEAQGKTPAKIVATGGRITAGTDAPFVPYGFGLHVELQLLVRGGLTPFEALRSATLWAAEAVGVERDLGTVAEGKLADLVIVHGDPLSDVAHTLNVVTTIKNGKRYDVESLLQPPQSP